MESLARKLDRYLQLTEVAELSTAHQELEEDLRQYAGLRFLTPEEESKVRQIKKVKLRLKELLETRRPL